MDELLQILGHFHESVRRVNLDEMELVYRGLPNFNYDNKPCLFRKPDWLKKERIAVEEVVRHYPEECAHAHTIDILTRLQHYECPTRMLDVTSNFLVALFFACGGWSKVKNPQKYEDSNQIDGAVRIFQVKRTKIKSIDSETVTVIANIARMENGKKFGELPWLCEKDWGVWQNDNDLLLQSAKDANSVVLVKTKLNNPRVRAQFGEFFLFGGLDGIANIGDLKCLRETPVKKKEIELPSEYVLSDLLVPVKSKKKILDCLEKYCGITYATLCPERQDFIQTLMM